MSFYAETLLEPKLRFGRDTLSSYPIRGLRDGGPYDVTLLSKDRFDTLLLYSKSGEQHMETFINGLQNGETPFEGFSSLFKKSLYIRTRLIDFGGNFDSEIRNLIKTTASQDAIFILLPEETVRTRSDELYFKGKLILCAQGIPTQYITPKKIRENKEKGSFGYYLQNVSLALYAKLGKKPWVLHRPSETVGSDIVLGVGGTRFYGKNYFAFTTLFERNGAFDWWSADIPKDPNSEEEYVELLRKQVSTAIEEYRKQNPDFQIERVSFHISGKRPGRLETRAIEEFMGTSSEKFSYTIFHINTTSPFWIIDNTNSSKFFHPLRGLKVRLSSKDFLVMTDEPGDNPRAPIGPTRVTLIKHNLKDEEFGVIHQMVNEVYHLTRMNWRSFRAKNVPVSVYYPHIIARFMEKFKQYDDGDHLTNLRSNIPLKRKAWFL